MTSRSPSGAVVVSVARGKLRLRLPRQLFGGEQRYLYLGLPDTPVNREAAEARAKLIEHDIAFDKFDPTLERYRVQALISNGVNLPDLWQRYTTHKARELEQTTITKDFKRVANHLERCPIQKLAGVTSARRIRGYLQENCTPATTRKMLSYLRACCAWAVDEGLIESNPFDAVRVTGRTKKPEPNPFTKAEMDAIISAFATHPTYAYYLPYVRFLFLTGCRTSEAIGLQWQHIHPDHITFSTALVEKHRKGTKTGTIRQFPINGQLRELLDSLRPSPQASPDALVFTAPSGSAIDAHNFLTRAWKKVLSDLPIAYRPQYATRATFISLCLHSGRNVKQIAAWVGNSPETIWKHYAGLVSSESVPLF